MPLEVVDVAVIVPPTHNDVAVTDTGLTVGALTITARETVVLQLFAPVTVYEIVAVPALIPDTTPLALTVAIFVRFDDQVPPAVLFVNVVVASLQTVKVPAIFATVGTSKIVTIFVAEAEQLVCVFV